MADCLYQVEHGCPVCDKTFSVTKVRLRLFKIRQDDDFCSYYRDVNPYYYSVWVCPHCGYAAADSYFDELSPAGRDQISQFLSRREVKADFTGVRTRGQAIGAYKLAIFYGGLIELPASKMGGLHLKLGWLYREAEETALEREMLCKTIEFYEHTLDYERFPIGNMTEISIQYLIAALYNRVGEYKTAAAYLAKIMSNERAKAMERNIYDSAREIWQELRARQRAAR